jgi:hypothetical protein
MRKVRQSDFEMTASAHSPHSDNPQGKCAAGAGRPSLGLRPRSVRPAPAQSHPDCRCRLIQIVAPHASDLCPSRIASHYFDPGRHGSDGSLLAECPPPPGTGQSGNPQRACHNPGRQARWIFRHGDDQGLRRDSQLSRQTEYRPADCELKREARVTCEAAGHPTRM